MRGSSLPTMHAAFPDVTSRWFSPAKINLCLRIVGRRADGYHLLDSIFAAIDFGDHIDVRVANVGRQRNVDVRVHCDRTDVPSDATNLAARAAATLLGECRVGADVDLAITKRVPPGTGLGGGSSNAATILMALNARLGLGVPPARVHALALTLGADVPFFLTGGCARVGGIGERIEPFPGWPGQELVIAIPPVAVATAWAFRTYAGGLFPDADDAARLAGARVVDPTLLRNDLETVVLSAHPEIGRLKTSLLASGAEGAVMSGSGSAVVGLVPAGMTASSLAATLRERNPGVAVHCTRILPAGSVG